MRESTEKAVLIVGAGEAGQMVVREIESHRELRSRVVGFLDDDPALAEGIVMGLPVLGKTGELEDIVARTPVDEIIIAIPTAPGRFVRNMVKRCKHAGVPFKIVPGIIEIIKGDVRIDQIREVRVADLLGRETVDFDIESAKSVLSGQKILVTGAGGSIGSELSRQLFHVEPAELILLGRGENRIFEIEEDLKSDQPRFPVTTVIADLRDGDRVRRIIGGLSPQIVYHTAAHKHVHYMERDPVEAVINNVEGSINVIRASEEFGVERFLFLSTDKAAVPHSVMGATKRVIELYLRSRNGKTPCRFITVRFGNVIGSTGSVVPLFLKQISRGGPVTVSDLEATRFFMTVKEASLLVIRASVIGKGGETFILDMGEPLNILEIARDIILLTGHEPDVEIPITVTGLRDGEKLHEVLVSSDEELITLNEEKILLAKPSIPLPPDLEEGIAGMIESARRGNEQRVLQIMTDLIPDFGQPSDSTPKGS